MIVDFGNVCEASKILFQQIKGKNIYDDAIEYIDCTNASLHQLSYDIVNFLNWAAEPELEKRKSLGVKVILFLIVLTALLYVTMKETWSRIEK